MLWLADALRASLVPFITVVGLLLLALLGVLVVERLIRGIRRRLRDRSRRLCQPSTWTPGSRTPTPRARSRTW